MQQIRLFIPAVYPPNCAASQRYRVEQFLPYLSAQGIVYRLSSFWTLWAWRVLYLPNHSLLKGLGLLAGIVQRILDMRRVFWCTHIWLHREAIPLGSSFWEWVAARILNKKIIFDFDDAIWLGSEQPSSSAVVTLLKNPNKTAHLCKLAHTVCVGNEYLAAFARQHHAHTYIVPTTVDITRYTSSTTARTSEKIIIGWIGSHSTIHYLQLVSDALHRLAIQIPFELHVIADHPPSFPLPNLHFFRWDAASEIEQIKKFDIGIMPLPNNAWTQGKCGFKAIQYLALGIPTIASPVGANLNVVPDQQVGLLCSTPDEWLSAFRQLASSPTLRRQMGEAGIRHIHAHYSLQSQLPALLQLFR
jgi:glycosyltransferase involved in cell wall biosynthesis